VCVGNKNTMKLALSVFYVVVWANAANAVSTPQPSTTVGAEGDPHPFAWLEVRASLVSSTAA
jgi:hypothetical protein